MLLRGNETILVVDDDSAVLRLTNSILTFHGYTVNGAASGKKNLQLFAVEPEITVDLLLIDIVMPGMNGPNLSIISGSCVLGRPRYTARVIRERVIFGRKLRATCRIWRSRLPRFNSPKAFARCWRSPRAHRQRAAGGCKAGLSKMTPAFGADAD
jgi:hypothetical protein